MTAIPLVVAISLAPLGSFAAGAPTGPVATASLEALFQIGVEQYGAQDYDGAIAEWEKLRRFRVVSPAVEFNLGNAYYKRQQYGRAVLHWERARRLDPADADPATNLRLVRGLLVDDLVQEPSPFREVFESVRMRVPAARATALAAVAWVVLGIAVFVALVGTGGVRRAGAIMAAILAAVVVLVVPFACYQMRMVARADAYVVLVQVVEVRSGPGQHYTTKFSVHEGLVVRRVGTASGWERVLLPNHLDGWLPAAAVEEI